MNAGPAEATLTATHTGIAAALDGINRGGDNGTVQCLHDLSLGDGLATADDPTVERVLLDKRCFFLGGEPAEHGALTGIGEVLLRNRVKPAALQQLHRFFRNSRRSGEPGGTDPGEIDKAGRLL